MIGFIKKTQWKLLKKRFVGIVVSGQISGSYWNAGGASINDALKTSKST